MDLWIILTPVLKTLFYVTSLLALGTVIFERHFQHFQTVDNTSFCRDLTIRACKYGTVISAGLLVSVAGNLGGEVWSILDPTIFSIAIYSKGGHAAGLAFFGFALIIVARRYEFSAVPLLLSVGVLLVLTSFIWTGHAQKVGPIAQAVLSLHLVAIAWIFSAIATNVFLARV